MFVYEEKILKEFNIHVFDIVGWEGVWGILISSIFMAVFFFIPGKDFGSFENPIQATQQVTHNWILLSSLAVSVLVIGPFNYFGTSLTKYSSAMHRCLIDASRMCVVWLISIIAGWEHFSGIQALGYLIILIGNLIYYEVLTPCGVETEPSSSECTNQPQSCLQWMFPAFFKKPTEKKKNEKSDDSNAHEVDTTKGDVEDSMNLLNNKYKSLPTTENK